LSGAAVLRARVQVTQDDAAIRRENRGIALHLGAHTGELPRRHDEEKLLLRLRQNDEFLGLARSPADGIVRRFFSSMA
jgi:hypothetical protein